MKIAVQPESPAARRALIRRGMIYSSWEAVLAMPVVYLWQPGNLVVAVFLSELLELSPATYGAVVSLPFWTNLLQLPLVPLLSQRFGVRTVFVATIWLHVVIWGALGALLMVAPDWVMAHRLTVAYGFIGVSGLVASVMAVCWAAWMQSWVPPGVRGKYFARRNGIAQVVTLAFLLLAGWLLARPSLLMMGAIFFGAALLRALSAFTAQATPAPEGKTADEQQTWGEQWQSLRAQPGYFRAVFFMASWAAVANAAGVFQPIFMLQVLGVSVEGTSWPIALSMLAGALAMRLWGPLLDRFGARPVLFCLLPMWVLAGVPWLVVTPSTAWLLNVAWALAGAVNAGIVLGQLNLLMKLIPPGSRALAVGFNTALGALGAALAPMLAGRLLDGLMAAGWGASETYRLFFWIMPLGVLVPFWLLRRIQEPRAAPVEHVLGALRNVRMLGAALGLGFLAQVLWIPLRRGKRGES